MHIEPTPANQPSELAIPWYRELNRYHWFVMLVAALGWLFDTMDQQLFTLARGPAIAELHGETNAQFMGGLATMVFMMGWATGGIIFGIMGDRYGRAKTMMITILVYSLFTGLSALSINYWDFLLYRFLTGLGVGGEFAVGVALVAEVMPERARPHALGWLQACSAVGNVTAAFISMGLAPLEAAGALGDWKPWRYMFVIGALPALLALLIRRKLKEPERWQAIKNTVDNRLGSLRDLFHNPTWRRHAIFGLLLATSGVVGLWGIGFFSVDLVRSVFREKLEREAIARGDNSGDRWFVQTAIFEPDQLGTVSKKIKSANYLLDPEAKVLYAAALRLFKSDAAVTPAAVIQNAQAHLNRGEPDTTWLAYLNSSPDSKTMSPDELMAAVSDMEKRTLRIESDLTWWSGVNGLLLNIGAFFGIYAFSRVTHVIGRKPAFAITFVLAMLATALVFGFLRSVGDVFWMIPIMGFFQIALFGGFAIYFPELFPTHLRSTGTSFCYNVGRYAASPGPLLLGWLASMVFGQYGEVASWRYAGVTMSSFFLLGLVVLPFLPETRGKPLPE